MKDKRFLFIAGMLALLALLTAGGVATVFAAGPTAPNERSRGEEFLNRLANNLGISTDKLQEGLKTTAKQGIDNAVADGRITQDQADRAKEKIDEGNGLDAFMRFFGRRVHDRDLLRFSAWNDLAGTLGLSPQELRDQLRDGKTVKQIISDQNKTVDEVVDAIAAEMQERLDTAVANGRLSQERADSIIAHLKTCLTELINNGGPRPHQNPDDSATPSGFAG